MSRDAGGAVLPEFVKHRTSAKKIGEDNKIGVESELLSLSIEPGAVWQVIYPSNIHAAAASYGALTNAQLLAKPKI